MVRVPILAVVEKGKFELTKIEAGSNSSRTTLTNAAIFFIQINQCDQIGRFVPYRLFLIGLRVSFLVPNWVILRVVGFVLRPKFGSLIKLMGRPKNIYIFGNFFAKLWRLFTRNIWSHWNRSHSRASLILKRRHCIVSQNWWQHGKAWGGDVLKKCKNLQKNHFLASSTGEKLRFCVKSADKS